jgi:hypothetical protein
MNIVKEYHTCRFGDLKTGDVFTDAYGAYHMKIEVYSNKGDSVNFVTLRDGLLGGWYDDELIVTKVNCELVIKE